MLDEPAPSQDLIEAVATRVTELLIPRLADMIGNQTDEFRAAHARLADRVTAIETHTVTLEAVAMAAWNAARASIDAEPGDAPPQLVHACQQPAGVLNDVIVNVYGRRVHRRVAGGSDPLDVWRDLCESVLYHAAPNWRPAQ